jgi:NAD dependent epimerase/dehydratase
MSKKVLVTGADGFLGSHLTEHLLGRGYDVTAFIFYNSFNSWGWLDTLPESVKNQLNVVAGDIRDGQIVKESMKNMHTVYHLAALVAIPFSYAAPQSYIETNILGTHNILQAARELDTENIIMTSTSEVYGTARSVPISEDHPLQPQSPYSASKIGADALALSFHHSFGLPVRLVRPFNTFGPRQSARAFIPSLVIQLLSGSQTDTTPQIKLGNLEPTRDFSFVQDTARGFVSIAESSSTLGETVNIASGKEHKIGDIANYLIARIDPRAQIVLDETRLRPAQSEVDRLLGCNDKIKRLTTWRPQTAFEEGLDITVQWFKENIDQYKADTYNV